MMSRTSILSLVILAVLTLACGKDDAPETDDTTVDFTTVEPMAPPPEFYVDADPPGAIRGKRYEGVVFLRDDPGMPVFSMVTGVEAVAARPDAMGRIRAQVQSPVRLALSFTVNSDASSAEMIFLTLTHPGGSSGARLYLRTVEGTWDASWRPVAVAPPDTSVAGPSAMVVLDGSRSHHPAGAGALHFAWIVEGRGAIRGQPAVPVTLGVGDHAMILEASDDFGWVSRDTMRVRVTP